MKNRILTTTLIILTISLTFGLAMFGLNFITGPMIEANNQGAEFAPLLAVMPEGAEFGGDALIYDKANASASTLNGVPASVLSVYKEKNGLGFAIRVTAESSYSTAPMEITIGVTAEGKICGIQIDSYNDTASFDFRQKDPTYLDSYIGQDSALADVGLVAGSTYSSTAFKNAVSEALGVLIANDLITAGVKTDAQILEELIPTVAPGIVKATELTASGNIQKALKSLNNSGFAYIMTEGEASYLAVVNAVGVCKFYNVEGTDVTADHETLVTEAKTHASANQISYVANLTTKLGIIMANAENITPVEFDTFGNVLAAVSFQNEGANYYAFYSSPLTYDNNAMVIVTVLDENGAIVKQDIENILYGHGVEYLPVYGQGYGDTASGKYNSYEDLFSGMTSGTLNDSVLISGATISSTAIKTATADVFAAFESIKGGEQ